MSNKKDILDTIQDSSDNQNILDSNAEEQSEVHEIVVDSKPNIEFLNEIRSVTTFNEFKEKILNLKKKASFYFSIYMNRILKWAELNKIELNYNSRDENSLNNIEKKLSVPQLIEIVTQPPNKKRKRKTRNFQHSNDLSETEEIVREDDKSLQQGHNVALMSIAILHDEIVPLMNQVHGKLSENTLEQLNVGVTDIRKEKWELIRNTINSLAPQLENRHGVFYPQLASYDPK